MSDQAVWLSYALVPLLLMGLLSVPVGSPAQPDTTPSMGNDDRSLLDDMPSEIDSDTMIEGGVSSLEDVEGDTQSRQQLKLNVNEIEGSVVHRSDSTQAWGRIQEGESVVEDGELVVPEGSSVTLRVKGVAVMKLEPGSTLTVDKLARTVREEGLLTETETLVNEMELEMEEGTVKSKVRSGGAEENNVTLRTPDAVAGIRGTAFECDRSGGAGTSCSVLEGEVRLASRGDTDQFQTLTSGKRSQVGAADEEPSQPEDLDEQQQQELQEFDEDAEQLLADEIQLEGIQLNGEPLDRDGQGRFVRELPYDQVGDLELRVNLNLPEGDTDVPRVVLRHQGEERSIEGESQWEFTLSPSAPEDGSRENEMYHVYWEDGAGNRSRAFPVALTLVNAESQGALPGGLREGDVPIEIDQFGGQPFSSLRFPYRLSSQDLVNLRIGDISDTSVLSNRGIEMTGSVGGDSEVVGVGYRFREGEPWMRASESENWELSIPLETLRTRGAVEVQLIAWTGDGSRGAVRSVGPIEFESVTTTIPVDYESTTRIEGRVTTVAGQSVTASDFPITITSGDLNGDPLTVSGEVDADTRLEGLAVRVNGGQWQTVTDDDLSNWTVQLTSGNQSRTYELEAVAWSANREISRLMSLGTIQYEWIETTVPTDYEDGQVPVEVATIGGRDAGNAEYPLHLYQNDVSGGIPITGTASGDSTIEGVAYSTDGGQSWTRVEGGASWSLELPAEGSVTYDQLQVVAWTVAGVRGDPVNVGTVEYEDRTYDNVFRTIFEDQWDRFGNERLNEFFAHFSQTDFQFQDSVTGQQWDYGEFERVVQDVFDGVRNLRTNRTISRVLTGPTGGELIYDIEWRGTASAPDRPFLVKGQDVSQQFTRAPDGQFEIVSIEDLPPILYLFNKEAIRMDDLGGVIVKSLETAGTARADILYESVAPDLRVNRMAIGGPVSAGGIQAVSGGFSSVESIPTMRNGYDTDVIIEEGKHYAVNIRKSGVPSTALIRVVDIRSSFVEVRIISAQSLPGQSERPFTQYRGVVPFD